MSDIEEITSTLNPRQIRFAREYVIDLNGTQAYIRAGYEDTDGASASASRLLRHDKVSALIKRFQQEKADRLMLSADYALSKLRANIEAAAMAEKFSDVNKGVETLLKHFGELTERVDMNVSDTDHKIEMMRQARARVAAGVETDDPEDGPNMADPINAESGELPE